MQQGTSRPTTQIRDFERNEAIKFVRQLEKNTRPKCIGPLFFILIFSHNQTETERKKNEDTFSFGVFCCALRCFLFPSKWRRVIIHSYIIKCNNGLFVRLFFLCVNCKWKQCDAHEAHSLFGMNVFCGSSSQEIQTKNFFSHFLLIFWRFFSLTKWIRWRKKLWWHK